MLEIIDSMRCRLVEGAVIIVALFTVSMLGNAAEKRDFFITLEAENDAPYMHEPTAISVMLYSVVPNVLNASETSPSKLDHGEFSFNASAENFRRSGRVEIDGRTYYTYPLSTFIVSLAEKGRYQLSGGEYVLDVAVPTNRSDRFFGRATERRRFRVEVDPLKLKVKGLPSVRNAEAFSGVVGDFEIKTTVPPGDVIVNEEGLAIVTIKGYGLLSDDVLPDYNQAFTGNIKLKSISENRRNYMEDGQLISELRLECTFVPESRKDVTIGEVIFHYFNPITGKYEEKRSDPVQVVVKSSTVRREVIEI